MKFINKTSNIVYIDNCITLKPFESVVFPPKLNVRYIISTDKSSTIINTNCYSINIISNNTITKRMSDQIIINRIDDVDIYNDMVLEITSPMCISDISSIVEFFKDSDSKKIDSVFGTTNIKNIFNTKSLAEISECIMHSN